jgi:glycosyltransferase involved in cell wall biosynthesis
MRAADAFVLPTRYEPFGLVITEALACGTPVVTARSAGAAELTRDGSEAILLDDPWDVAELAAALRRLAEARERWPQMAAAARAAAMPWTWDKIWRQTDELYSELLERRYAESTPRVSPRAASSSAW